MFIRRFRKDEFIDREEERVENIFKEIAKEVTAKGFYVLKDKEDREKVEVINFMSEKEILFLIR